MKCPKGKFIWVFIFRELSLALYASVDKYLHGLFGLANEPPAEVRKLVCAAFVQLIEVRPSVLEPHMKNVIEYMLQVNKDTDDEVALEACEFWDQSFMEQFGCRLNRLSFKVPKTKWHFRVSTSDNSYTYIWNSFGTRQHRPYDICLAIWTTTPWTAPANADGLCNECYEEMSSHVPTRRSYLLLPATIVPLETVLSLKLKFMLLLAGAVHEGFRRARWRIRSSCIPAC
ncbi:hypothetical protein ES288_A11G176700v1 [Gossypium darwinii]|uniref:Uncharacterized protein n=1 Tax=Gossypium darwinii TaxID=34276 RepID=A0A5D2ELC1_GOSDA|nr:hypothetical protein ES288_A11G176700v1 [Gossypium darwinii]